MSEVTRDDVRHKVTPVGNSWIVCKSKRHQGHVYYFNSLTGEAAWNLSDAEIEKAKHRTKHLECIPGAQPTTCPEPKDKPPGTLYEPLIFNNVTEQQSSVFKFGNSDATVCTNLSQVSGVLQGSQINNPTPVKPVQLIPFNNRLTTYTVNSATSVYNPKVWDVPQTQQIFVGPTIAPLLNHTAYPINVGFSNLSQPLPGVLKQGETTDTSRTYYPRDNNYGQRGHRGINKKVAFPKNDLRQKILERKRFYGKQSSFFQGNARKPETSPRNAPNDEAIDSVDVNDGTKKGRSKTHLQEAPSKLNVMPLKRLAPPESSLDAWFIIVDLGVLLNEFKFLTTLTDSDEKCHLMVPKRLMEELKTYVTCTENIQARRILRFLSQQIEIGYANMAEEPCNLQGNDMAEVILKTCEDCMDKKYHVVLISDDNEVLTKASPNMHVFTTVKIKNLLSDYSNKQTELPIHVKKPFLIDKLFNKIQITVPNNSSQVTETISTDTDTHDKSTLHIDGQGIQKHNTIQEVNNVKTHSTLETRNQTLKEKQDKIEQCVLVKHTVDAGIQTDFEDVNPCTRTLEQQIEEVPEPPQNTKEVTKTVNKTLDMVEQNTQKVSEIPQDTKEIPQTAPEPLHINVAEKKSEIILKSSTSHEDHAPNLGTKKIRLKRGRKRNTAPQPIEQKSSHSDETSSVTTESPRKNTTDVVQTAQVEVENTILDKRYEGNSTTIEELSTGTVSNSDNNGDTILEVDPQIAEESNQVFKHVVFSLMQEIREALYTLQLLSVHCHKEMQKPGLSSKMKCELKKKVEEAHLNLIGLCKALERMADEKSNTPDKLRKLCKSGDIDIRHVDPALIEQYKLSLTGCKNIADGIFNAFQKIKSSFDT